MPKEAPGALPLPRSQHRGSLPHFRAQATHQAPASYHHVQQYLPRPTGYQFYPTPGTFSSVQNDAPTSSAPTSQSSAQASYEHVLKMASKFDRGALGAAYATHNFKVASYEQQSSSPASSPQTSVASHKPASYDRTSSALAGYRNTQPTSGSPYDHKMLYTSALPYDRFSKKKLAAHVSEKTTCAYKKPSRQSPYASSSYDRPVKPAPAEGDKAAGRSYYERRSQRQEAERQMDAYDAQSSSPFERTPSVSQSFERLTTAPTTPYDRITSSAAYERRAVFDRAYEAAAYDRRLYALTGGLGGSYYAVSTPCDGTAIPTSLQGPASSNMQPCFFSSAYSSPIAWLHTTIHSSVQDPFKSSLPNQPPMFQPLHHPFQNHLPPFDATQDPLQPPETVQEQNHSADTFSELHDIPLPVPVPRSLAFHAWEAFQDHLHQFHAQSSFGPHQDQQPVDPPCGQLHSMKFSVDHDEKHFVGQEHHALETTLGCSQQNEGQDLSGVSQDQLPLFGILQENESSHSLEIPQDLHFYPQDPFKPPQDPLQLLCASEEQLHSIDTLEYDHRNASSVQKPKSQEPHTSDTPLSHLQACLPQDPIEALQNLPSPLETCQGCLPILDDSKNHSENSLSTYQPRSQGSRSLETSQDELLSPAADQSALPEAPLHLSSQDQLHTASMTLDHCSTPVLSSSPHLSQILEETVHPPSIPYHQLDPVTVPPKTSLAFAQNPSQVWPYQSSSFRSLKNRPSSFLGWPNQSSCVQNLPNQSNSFQSLPNQYSSLQDLSNHTSSNLQGLPNQSSFHQDLKNHSSREQLNSPVTCKDPQASIKDAKHCQPILSMPAIPSAWQYPYPSYPSSENLCQPSLQFANRDRAEEYEAKEPATYPAKPRMSLLTSAEYLSSLSRRTQQSDDGARSGHPSVIVPPSRSPADSSPRKPGKNETLPPLTIDTSSSPKADPEKPSIYMPTVEPISPTSPPDQSGEDGVDVGGTGAPKSSAKDTLLIEIARVDREINKIEHHIVNLKRKQSELEQKAKKSELESSEETTEAPLPQHFSLSHKVYSGNRRKAKENHAAFSHLGPSVDLPLYNQPSDTPVYQENKLKHLLFKGRLISHLRRRRRDRFKQEKEMTAEYALRTENWNRLVEKMENSPERKRRDVENRELFEKVFPKIRKEREDRERFLRQSSRVKSDADLEEIMDNLHEQEMEVKKMRDYAAVPPLLLTAESRRCVYVNTNGRIEDFPAEYKERRLFNIWTDAEKDIFREKYLLYPKNFGAISSFLERKSVSDCVQHYYLSKKTENYKRILKKSGHKSKSGRNRNKTAAPPLLESVPTTAAPGLTIAPRFQRDYKPSAEVTPFKSEAPQLKPEAAQTAVKAQPPSTEADVLDEGPTLAPPLTPPAEPAPFVPAVAAPTATVPTCVTSPVPEAALPQAQTEHHQQLQQQQQQQQQQLQHQLQQQLEKQQQQLQQLQQQHRHQQLHQRHQQLQKQQQQLQQQHNQQLQQQQHIVHKPPPPLKPLMLPHLSEVVVIDDSDDSNSGSHFPYARK